MAFGPPLGVGVAGLSEYFDMEILPPYDLARNISTLNSVLPEGVSIKNLSAISGDTESLNSFISRYEYLVKGGDSSQIHPFLDEKEISLKREKYAINVRTMVEDAMIIDGDTTQLVLVDQGNIKVRLGEILPLIFNTPMERLDITRIALYGWKGSWVRPLNTHKIQLVNCKM
jgi:hypothetical protein